MKKNLLSNYLFGISDNFFFILLMLYQLIFLFQGFDFADEGCHAAFFQLIFSHPETMVGNFMYWFSGIFGGVFYYFFSDWGLLGLRFQGLITIMATMIIAYYLIKEYISLVNLRIAILLIFALTTNEIKEMHYDTLAALLNVSAVFFLFRGIRDNKNLLIVLSGAFISLSMFTRLPSIVLLGLVISIFYFGLLTKAKTQLIIKQSLSLLGGFFLMSVLVLFAMKLMGHLSIYIEALKMVFSWGTSSEDGHSMLRLLKNFVKDYTKAINYGILIMVLMSVLILLNNLSGQISNKVIKWIRMVIAFVIPLLIGYQIHKHSISHASVISVFTGIALIASLFILASRSIGKENKLLVIIGCLIVFLEPFGSAGGISTSGKHSLWILFPFAIDFLFRLDRINGLIKFSSGQQESQLYFQSGSEQLSFFRIYFFSISLLACIYFSYYYPYFDMSDRVHMRYSISDPKAKGLYTTQERATVVNELLKESSKYIKKKDYVLAYDCMPMFHYLTETLPYMPNTWPWLYVPEAFDAELNKARINHVELPVIILQKMSTLFTNWPQNFNNNTQRSIPESRRDSIMNDFMLKGKYKKVWENKAFEIRIPD
jgi:hypothetical protein